MLKIAIDGACRRNGQPSCVSAGGVFIQQFDEDFKLVNTIALSKHEYESTNQRGELLALLTALDYVASARHEAIIITDSEYIFNAMTKQWCNRWKFNGWKTATDESVKNADIWREISHVADICEARGIEIAYYHIKGHCIPFGEVTAEALLTKDQTGYSLLKEVYKKYDSVVSTKQKALAKAQELSVKNNGYELAASRLRSFVVANVVVDAIATSVVNAADRKI